MREINARTRAGFKRRVRNHWRKHGRHNLPWRKTTNPYHVLVSEVMLQQTQVDRVTPKYLAFLKRFPTVRALARAPLRDVLQTWSGLGYNRRGKMLHDAAQAIVHEHDGEVPMTSNELEKLPGVGPYTAAAVMVFAHNDPVVMLETNIRSVFIHEFFTHHKTVSDRSIHSLIYQTMDRKHPREWYWALMDYGAHIKRTMRNPGQKSSQYVKQSPFAGSVREVRGTVIRTLVGGTGMSERVLTHTLPFSKTRLQQALQSLQRDGLVQYRRGRYRIV